MYKILENNQIIDVMESMKFVKYDWEDIDLSWISKDASGTAEDVLGRFIADMFMYVMSMAEMPEYDATME